MRLARVVARAAARRARRAGVAHCDAARHEQLALVCSQMSARAVPNEVPIKRSCRISSGNSIGELNTSCMSHSGNASLLSTSGFCSCCSTRVTSFLLWKSSTSMLSGRSRVVLSLSGRSAHSTWPSSHRSRLLLISGVICAGCQSRGQLSLRQ